MPSSRLVPDARCSCCVLQLRILAGERQSEFVHQKRLGATRGRHRVPTKNERALDCVVEVERRAADAAAQGHIGNGVVSLVELPGRNAYLAPERLAEARGTRVAVTRGDVGGEMLVANVARRLPHAQHCDEPLERSLEVLREQGPEISRAVAGAPGDRLDGHVAVSQVVQYVAKSPFELLHLREGGIA